MTCLVTRFAACLAVAAGMLGCPVAEVHADIKVAPDEKQDLAKRERLVPTPVEVTVKVVRGADVEFIVRAPTPSPKRVEFVVRRKPLAGDLEGPMVVAGDKHAARFRYSIPVESDEELVDFEVAARLPGGGISKAVPMRIRVEDAVAILETKPKMVRFEKAVVGKPTRYSPVEITNVGNTSFRGELSFPAGWTTHNLDGVVEIEPGETHRFGLRYVAGKPGFFNKVTFLQPGVEESGLHLVAEAIRALAATPGKLVLEWDAETRTRRGKLNFHNRDDVEWILHLWGSDRMVMPAKVVVARDSVATTEIVLPRDDIEALESRLEAKSGGLKLGVTVTAAATPAAVSIEEPADGVLDFGEVMQGDEEVVLGVVFENSGGTAAPLTLRSLPPFTVVGSEDGIEVPGGGRRLVHLRAESSTAGRFDRVLFARAGGAQIPLELKFQVAAPEAVVIDTGVKGIVLELNEPEKLLSIADISEMDGSMIFEDLDKLPQELTQRMARQSFYGVSPFDRHFRDDLPAVGDLHLVAADRGSVTFGFKPVKGARSYVVEMGTVVYHPQTRLLTKEWRGLKKKDLRLSSHPGEVRITLRGIPAGAGRELRVFAVFSGSQFGRPCAPVFFQTLPPLVIPWKKLAMTGALLLLLLGVLAFRNQDWVADRFGSIAGSFLAGLSPTVTRGKGGLRPSPSEGSGEEFEILPAKKTATSGTQKQTRKRTDTQKLVPEEAPPVPRGLGRSEKDAATKGTDTQKLTPEEESGAKPESDPFMPGEIPKL